MQPKRVLIVEDDGDLRMLFRTMLRSQKAQIDEAADGEEASERLRSSAYDLVILDIMLPHKNGFEIAEQIRGLDPRPYVIVVSAIARFFAERFDPEVVVLQKPFKMDELTEAIRSLPGD